jgi:hypothetical protein
MAAKTDWPSRRVLLILQVPWTASVLDLSDSSSAPITSYVLRPFSSLASVNKANYSMLLNQVFGQSGAGNNCTLLLGKMINARPRLTVFSLQGPRVITLRVPNLLTAFSTCKFRFFYAPICLMSEKANVCCPANETASAKRPKDVIASKVSRSHTRSVVVPVLVWEHSLFPRSERVG